MNTIYTSPFFGLSLTLIAYSIGKYVSKRVKISIANEMLVASLFIISILLLFKIPFDSYMKGAYGLQFMIVPATIALSYGVYIEISYVKKYFIPILVGSIVGSAVSIGSVLLLSRLFDLPQVLEASLIPKSVTTAIAIELSELLQGTPSITIMAVLFTGFTGIVVGPIIVRLTRIKDPVIIGLSFGISSHAIGTAKAFEYGEVEGAMSGIAIFFTGIMSVIISLIIF
ncbi:MAG: LrgB family protein [Spirochaetia bacterium]|nr:LrgB family protein [Spirochaetia bacterium]